MKILNDKPALKILELLSDARFVGGAVRDGLLGIHTSDIDIATSHKPDEVIKILKNNNIKTIPTGIKHGTVTAIINDRSFEITTLRRDIDCDGRHAEVEFTDDWKEDAARRDFTINAISIDKSGKIYDYFSGKKDLEEGVVRFIGNPEERILEDHLRILRFFRFYSYYGKDEIEPRGFASCKQLAHKLQNISGERIKQEILKLLSSLNPNNALNKMQEAGILDVIFDNKKIRLPITPILNSERELKTNPDPIVRLSYLLHGNDVEQIIERFKFSNKQSWLLETLVQNKILPTSDELSQKKLIKKFGNEVFIKLILLSNALNKNATYKNMMVLSQKWTVPEMPLKGEDLISIGISPGKKLGELLKLAEECWENSDFSLKRSDLLKLAQEKSKDNA